MVKKYLQLRKKKNCKKRSKRQRIAGDKHGRADRAHHGCNEERRIPRYKLQGTDSYNLN